jgi:hypothetical protein
MSELPSGREQARVGGTCDGTSLLDDRRAPVDRDGPVIRKSIGAAPVSRPAKTEISYEYPATGEGDISPVALMALLIVLLLLGIDAMDSPNRAKPPQTDDILDDIAVDVLLQRRLF